MAIRSALGGLAVLLGAGGAMGAEFTSAYTRHEFERCPESASPEPGVIVVRVCQGYGGVRVRWTSEPDSSWVEFGELSAEEPLSLGGEVYEAGTTVEWRGVVTGSGPISAEAAIIRYAIGRSVGRTSRTRLVVYRLQSDRSCIMGTASTNVAARDLVDRRAQSFVCGQSRRIEGGWSSIGGDLAAR